MTTEARRAMLMILAGLATLPAPALAQSMPGMPGMKMPSKPAAKPKPKPKPKPAARRAPVPAVKTKPHAMPPGMTMSVAPAPAPAPAESPQPAAPIATMDMPAAPAEPMAEPMAGMNMARGSSMAGMPTWPPRRFSGCREFPDPGPDGIVSGGYRCQPGDGSGTSRQPASGEAMGGLHLMAGGWMLMLHGYAWGAYTDQSGPRGDSQAFVTTMAMVEARRDLGGEATLTLRSMLSLDPLMGRRGYPSLLATGETANGVTPLIDRQHPHDLFMELSARIEVPVSPTVNAFVYGGPVAEPALGPSAFMHRSSARFLPLAAITHHWFDSTHITFGVVTAGLNTTRWQVEGSAFRGREPDQRRWDIETPRLDSWSVRATWNPSAYWSAQVSHGRLKSPEALEPGLDEARTTASVQYARGGFSALAGFSVKNRLPGRSLTAWIGEANLNMGSHHSLFGRIENVANDELFPDPASPLHDRPFRVTRGELGYAYRLKLVGPVEAAIGGSGFLVGTPRALDGAYGTAPVGWTGFLKLSLGG